MENGSKIAAVSSAEDTGRSKAISLLIVDEAAFIENAEEIWKSAYSTLSTGGRSIILSTPNGVGNWFHKIWTDSQSGRGQFHLRALKWDCHPERDQSWRDEQTEHLGIRGASQECDANFLSSGDNLIDLVYLKEYEQQNVQEPKEERMGNSIRIFEAPKFNSDYILSADTSRGDAKDYSAAHIIEIATLNQVAEVQIKCPSFQFGDILVELGTEYNSALLVVEHDALGNSTIQRIVEHQYPNLYYTPAAPLKVVGTKSKRELLKQKYGEFSATPGISVNTATRPLMIDKLRETIEKGYLSIRGIRTIKELETFVWLNGKVQAAEGYNDDLVMSLAAAIWVYGSVRLNAPWLIPSQQAATIPNETKKAEREGLLYLK